VQRKDETPSAHSSADPPRNFTLSVDERIRALTIGAPAYAIRKRKIEDLESRWVATLLELREQLEAKGTPEADVAHALRAKAATFDYRRVNELVLQHNRWYPIEANLRIDPKTHGYLVYGRPWLPEPAFSAERISKRVT
jgi:hypothetical protein